MICTCWHCYHTLDIVRVEGGHAYAICTNPACPATAFRWVA